MEHLSDQELIDKVKKYNCSDSLNELAKRHQGIFCKMAHKYANMCAKNYQSCSGLGIQDFLDNQLFITYQAICDYDPDRNTKFVTWLGNKTRFYCLNTIAKQSRYISPESDTADKVSDFKTFEDSQQGSDYSMESEYVLEILNKLKDKRVKRVIELRYFSEDKQDRIFSSIAKKLEMSTQGVINMHDNFIKFMQTKIRSKENMDTV